MVTITRTKGELETPQLLALAIFVVVVIFNLGPIKLFFTGYQPKNLPVISSSDLTDLISSKRSKPTLVYFYHKITDSTARSYLPVLDEFAAKYGDRVDFVRYPLGDYQKEQFKEYWPMESQMVVFKDGIKAGAAPGYASNLPSVSRGVTFKLLKEWIAPHVLPPEERKDWFVHAGEFETLVLNARRPVVVDFTCKTCPYAQMFEPQFKQIASANSGMAEFYLCDTNDPDNRDILWKYGSTATPTVALFYDGKRRQKISGASPQLDGNEAIILGMISSYYY
jgi:thiol-disulfide isomerase/thioredoxin